MRRINESNVGWNTAIALCLVPLSGFAMDIFIPSLPDMAAELHTSSAAIQLTLSVFLISYGVSQFIVGALIDVYGRYFPAVLCMIAFTISSFIIALSHNLTVIYWMRAIQGFAVAVIAVSKRAYFVDQFRGEKLKKYTSLLTVIWSIAPIVAPFLGGYFQTVWGWHANFIFLGFFGLFFFIIEIFSGGESMKISQPLRLKEVLNNYCTMLTAKEFTSGIVVLGLLYGTVILYGMASPFLIENLLHLSPRVTGYCSLFSGCSMLVGGTLSRVFPYKQLRKRIIAAGTIQVLSIVLLSLITTEYHNLFTLLMYVLLVHGASGFMFNTIFSYCLMRFPMHAGKSGGLVGGGFTVITAICSTFLVNVVTITSQKTMGLAYGFLAVFSLAIILNTKWKRFDEKSSDILPGYESENLPGHSAA